jgi:hypothetical protein
VVARDSSRGPEDRHPKRTRDWVSVAESLKASKRQRRKRTRRRTLLGLLGLLSIPVGVAVFVVAPAAVQAGGSAGGVCLLVLGLGVIAFNRVVAESGALVDLILGATLGGGPPEGSDAGPERRSQPHWYSPSRLVTLGGGLLLLVVGVAMIVG